jgi:superfamily II DNA helicase RecQ
MIMETPPTILSIEKIRDICAPRLGYRPCIWQAEVCQALLAGQHSVVLSTAATSAGKTATFFMPAMIEADGATMIVVPLKGLGGQMVEAAEALGFTAINITRENISDSSVIKVM